MGELVLLSPYLSLVDARTVRTCVVNVCCAVGFELNDGMLPRDRRVLSRHKDASYVNAGTMEYPQVVHRPGCFYSHGLDHVPHGAASYKNNRGDYVPCCRGFFLAYKRPYYKG